MVRIILNNCFLYMLPTIDLSFSEICEKLSLLPLQRRILRRNARVFIRCQVPDKTIRWKFSDYTDKREWSELGYPRRRFRLRVHTRDDRNANICRQPLGGRIEKSNPNPKPNKYIDDIHIKLSCNRRFLRACVYSCARGL